MVRVEAYRDVIVPYRKWLDAERPSACERFLKRLDSSDDATREGALGEAAAWNWLEPRCDRIQLNEDDSTGGPDFLCQSFASDFYVEVTTITVAKMSKATGLTHPFDPNGKFKSYGTATAAIKREVIDKSKQLGGLNGPALIFVATLHFEASAIAFSTHHLEELLVGARLIQVNINLETGESGEVGEALSLNHPLFFQARTLTPKREHVSGVLVGGFGFGSSPPTVRGVLHPQAIRPFNVHCLPDTCFGKIRPWPIADQSKVVWETADGIACDDKSDRQRSREASERRLRQQGLGSMIDRMFPPGSGKEE